MPSADRFISVPAASAPTRAARYLALVLGSSLLFTTAWAGTGAGGGTQSVAERELSRRNDLARQASEAVQRGNVARSEKDYAAAVSEYRAALTLLPKAPNFAVLRAEALQSYCEVSVLRAEELAMQANYDAANATLDAVLHPDMAPDCAPALKLKQQIQDPERHNPAATPQGLANAQEVRRLLTLADGHFSLGEFDKAREHYNKALAVDRYNTAARRGIEKVERRLSEHFTAARDQFRASAIQEVDEQWETGVPNSAIEAVRGPLSVELGGESVRSGETARDKIKRIRFPQVQLIDTTLQEVIEYLTMQSRNLDTAATSDAARGVNFVLSPEPGLGARRITISLTDVPLAYVLEAVARQAGTNYRADDSLVTIGTTDTSQMATRSFRVPAGFFSKSPLSGGGDATGTTTDPFGGGGDSGGSTVSFARVPPQEYLKQAGVPFPEGAIAYYSPATSTLTVRNTPANLDEVQRQVEAAMAGQTRQVRIQTRMLEVNQDNLDEFGFDTLLGAFNIGGNKVFGTGGTTGNTGQTATTLGAAYPLTPPVTGALPVGQNPLTAGNRSGSAAIPSGSLDALIGNPGRSVDNVSAAPAVFGLAGVFTDPQIQTVFRGLNQKKGIDISSAPTIVAKSGQKAKVEAIREFIYPTEFEPPEIPQDFGADPLIGINQNGGISIFQPQSSNIFPVTPTTPTAFEKKDVGHSMEVEATVGPDNRTIDLNLTPIYSAFEGFINYGTPITTFADGTTERIVLTENRIPQPVFRTNRADNISVTVWSGNTIVIAGLVSEERISVEDKTPLLGDLPYVGRLFRSSVDRVRQKVVIFTVRADVIDPAGETPHGAADATARN